MWQPLKRFGTHTEHTKGNPMAQAILDLYPDCVSDYGLLGCGLVTLLVVCLVGTVIAIAYEETR